MPQRLAVDRTMPLTVDGFLVLAGGARGDRAATLEHVGIGGLGGRQLAALSGGQLQRAMLAQAVLRRPELLVLDEATQGLDQAGEARFYRLIEALRTELGCGVLMVSHDLHVVMAASDRVICLNGHVCCEGTPTVVSAAPEYRALFGLGTHGALALYRHDHDHEHGHAGTGTSTGRPGRRAVTSTTPTTGRRRRGEPARRLPGPGDARRRRAGAGGGAARLLRGLAAHGLFRRRDGARVAARGDAGAGHRSAGGRRRGGRGGRRWRWRSRRRPGAAMRSTRCSGSRRMGRWRSGWWR